MKANSLTIVRIFVASPSDVMKERAKLETAVASLKPTSDYLGLTLEVVDWRTIVPNAGRPQQILFDQLKPTSWDIFVGILWHRFGTPPEAKDKDGKNYLSGTEEEFKTAYELWKRHKRPRIFMYRCMRDFPFDVDPDQLKRVKKFFKLIKNPKSEYRVLALEFLTSESFEKLVFDNLQKLLFEYGEQSKTPITPEIAQSLAPKIPNNLPRRAAFFGRAKEMDKVMRSLSPADRTWGVLVDGIGGIGKTALAVEAAHRSQESGSFDAFVFITAKQNILTPNGICEQTPEARTLDDFLNETARVLGQIAIAQLKNDAMRRALLGSLRTMRALLIYDNLETLSKDEQEAIADFLRELPQGCKSIITSRRRGGESAVWLRLEKLDWDASLGIIENQMSLDAGLANKLRRAESHWQKLYDETNGSPLALMHTLGLMRMRAALTFDGALAMLQGNRDSDLQKFIFQEARKELTANDKTALEALSFFVPSASFEAWRQVTSLSHNALETTIDRLNALSLVDVLPGEESYALHPLTRAFVRDELLADANIALETGMRFAQYWADYAENYGCDRYESYKKLDLEWANLEKLLQWLCDTASVKDDNVGNNDAAQMLVDIASSLSFFLSYSGRWDEYILLHKKAYDAARALNNWRKMGWRAFDIAWIKYKQGDIEKADDCLKKCKNAWKHEGTQGDQASATRLEGLIALQKKEYDEAETLLLKALKIRLNLNDKREVAFVLNSLGQLAHKRKRYDLAAKKYKEALSLAENINDKVGQSIYLGNLGELALSQKNWTEAYKLFERTLPLAEEVRSIELISDAYYGLSRTLEAEGRVDLALKLAQASQKIYERLRHGKLAEVRKLVKRLSAA